MLNKGQDALLVSMTWSDLILIAIRSNCTFLKGTQTARQTKSVSKSIDEYRRGTHSYAMHTMHDQYIHYAFDSFLELGNTFVLKQDISTTSIRHALILCAQKTNQTFKTGCRANDQLDRRRTSFENYGDGR